MTTGSVSISPRSGPPGLEISGRARVSFEIFDNHDKAAAKSADKWAY
jgi:hypothetical protein